MSKRLKLCLFCTATILVVVLIGYGVVSWINSESLRFYETGSQITMKLASFGQVLEKGSREKIGDFFAEDFEGHSLGLNKLELFREKDGIRELHFTAQEGGRKRDQAVREWERYLDGFESIEEVGMYIHRMEEWDASGPWVASVRFEVLGKPKGASLSGIDRAYFRMSFDATETTRIRSAELIEGVRLVSEQHHFSDVSEQAGINFENQFYSGFMDEDLKFGMIMYGPGGIAATDYDNDGFFDLFIPDGVESRLFRNLEDGSFEDTTEAAGLTGLDGVSVGIFADYDNDGFKDFFVSRTFNPNQLFRNNGDGTFSDVTEKSGIGEDCCTTVASWADYDNDGFLDLYVGRYLDPRKDIPTTFYARNGEPNQLYRNNGDGTFSNVTEEAGVGEPGLCLGTVFGDYDNDGFADLFVVNDFGRNTLYHNEGDGTFRDVATESNTLSYGAGMNASFGDYNNDGRLDIYVTNIRSEHSWFAESPTIHRYIYNSFVQGVWLTDLPLYMEMFWQSGFGFIGIFQQMASGNTLLRNKGDGTFEDVTWEASANPPGWFWGASFADFDNDGWQDLYAANGWVYNEQDTEIELQFLNNVVSRQDDYKTGIFFDPEHFGQTSWHGWERNRLLRNNGDGTFLEVGRPSGSDLIMNSRGVATADFWNRGVLDVAVAASTDRHVLLKNEVGEKRNWFAVELEGTQSNRDAVGARVTIESNGRLQMREVILGDGYGSQNSLRLYFGLDQQRTVDRMTVRWPASGTVQEFENVTANRIVRVKEGEDRLFDFTISEDSR